MVCRECGTDGTQGLRLIKEKSGVTVAQNRESALHAGMPESAIETGLVDYVLPPEEIPDRLIEFFKHPVSLQIDPDQRQKKKADYLRRILVFLANRTRHDFSQYKESTLVRLIERRMTVTRSRNVEEYLFEGQGPAGCVGRRAQAGAFSRLGGGVRHRGRGFFGGDHPEGTAGSK
ncbi:MAG: chemotaxis protein CheB [Desulfobacterales bacterium]